MKRYGHLFEKAFSKENLYQAYLDASRKKHGKRACFTFERRLAWNLERMHESLHNGTYKPQPYYTFTVYEPKRRTIYAPAFFDLVVQHAIYRVIYPIFSASFIYQSFACRKGKGTHKAADYAQQALRRSPQGSCTLKMDIRKFFYRIDRAILRRQIERKIKDRRFVDIMMVFADYGDPVGIPIGNLLSQVYALIYMSPVDHYIKREIGAERYCRYVDDFILFGISRDMAIRCLQRVITFLSGLRLELSKFSIATIARGVNFVGYRTWSSKRFIRKRSVYNLKRAVQRHDITAAISILGHACKTHSLRHLIKTIKEHCDDCLIPKVYRFHPHN